MCVVKETLIVESAHFAPCFACHEKWLMIHICCTWNIQCKVRGTEVSFQHVSLWKKSLPLESWKKIENKHVQSWMRGWKIHGSFFFEEEKLKGPWQSSTYLDPSSNFFQLASNFFTTFFNIHPNFLPTFFFSFWAWQVPRWNLPALDGLFVDKLVPPLSQITVPTFFNFWKLFSIF